MFMSSWEIAKSDKCFSEYFFFIEHQQNAWLREKQDAIAITKGFIL